MTAQQIRDAVSASQEIPQGSEINTWLESTLGLSGDPAANVRAEVARRTHIHGKLRHTSAIVELKALQSILAP